MYLCYDIEWDTDGEPVKLPKKVIIENLLYADDIEEALGEALSEQFGFLHKGFKYEPILALTL